MCQHASKPLSSSPIPQKPRRTKWLQISVVMKSPEHPVLSHLLPLTNFWNPCRLNSSVNNALMALYSFHQAKHIKLFVYAGVEICVHTAQKTCIQSFFFLFTHIHWPSLQCTKKAVNTPKMTWFANKWARISSKKMKPMNGLWTWSND